MGIVATGCFLAALPCSADTFVGKVIQYEPGTGFATDFASNEGFTDTTSIVGSPSRITGGDFGGPVDPFNPPYKKEHLLSLGEGGSVTLEFPTPVFNNPGNPFGIDFIIFGSAGFIIINGDFSGGGITDGSTFGQNTGNTQVSVSPDNQTFFTLNSIQSPTVDGPHPTDGSGDFSQPVNPDFGAEHFSDQGLEGIRRLYNGSAGGTGYDLSWAVDESGNPVDLFVVKYIRIQVLEGHSEIDGVSVVSPSLAPPSVEIVESFQKNPSEGNWTTFGDASLFHWNVDQQNLEVTWDSSKPNSYFYQRLGSVLTRKNDFTIGFDLQLTQIDIGTTEGKPFTFPIAIGVLNEEQAKRPDYFRGTGINPEHGPRGVAEWNYLPDSGFGATVSTGLISMENQWAYANTFPLEMIPGPVYHIQLSYFADSQTMTTEMTRDGDPFGPIETADLSNAFGSPKNDGFTDFDVNMLSITNYSDEGQNPPEFAGSIIAKGVIDDLSVKTTAHSFTISELTHNESSVAISLAAETSTTYWLERSLDLKTWVTISYLDSPVSEMVVLSDETPPPQRAFYRIRGASQ